MDANVDENCGLSRPMSQESPSEDMSSSSRAQATEELPPLRSGFGPSGGARSANTVGSSRASAVAVQPVAPRTQRPETPDFVRKTMQKLGADTARTEKRSSALVASTLSEKGCAAANAVALARRRLSGTEDPVEEESAPKSTSQTAPEEAWHVGDSPSVVRDVYRPSALFYDSGAVQERVAMKAILAHDLDRYRGAFSSELRAQLQEIRHMLQETDVRKLVDRFMEESLLMHEREARSQRECDSLRKHCEELLRLNAELRQKELLQVVMDMRDWARQIGEDAVRMRRLTTRVSADTRLLLAGLGIESQIGVPDIDDSSNVLAGTCAPQSPLRDLSTSVSAELQLQKGAEQFSGTSNVGTGIVERVSKDVQKIFAAEFEQVKANLQKRGNMDSMVAEELRGIKQALADMQDALRRVEYGAEAHVHQGRVKQLGMSLEETGFNSQPSRHNEDNDLVSRMSPTKASIGRGTTDVPDTRTSAILDTGAFVRDASAEADAAVILNSFSVDRGDDNAPRPPNALQATRSDQSARS